jgi:hypothetical protein
MKKKVKLKEICISHNGLAGGKEDKIILKLMKTFGAQNLGCGTFLPTLQRDMQFEVPSEKYSEAIKALKKFEWLEIVK